ncbi:hypothetical protein ACFQ48_09375 [Hymenobacter caeli]|uniref:Uncharacterized protein n=1 Tax=Hymenobacter caeli TaxID=2735894 RepID=A0ABX2FP75_9BACT|nr:hypothetical protein [Hymenobacter caeli]NRT18279.1 hypothetical protein [Hymenobacter caeli]
MAPRLLILALALLAAGRAHAQDLLTKRNGDKLAVKVLEITPLEVKYRRTDNPDGPLISVYKSEVFMIRYANGAKDVFGAAPTPVLYPAVPRVSPTPAPTAAAVPPGPVVPGDVVLPDEEIHLSGPRLGFTVLTDGPLNRGRQEAGYGNLNPFLTQFGWQFETRLFRLPNGVSGLAEFVPLVGGLEQGKFVPSVSGILGVRGPKGFEFGLGPNLTPLGANVVLALGTSFRTSSGLNFPVNLAVVPGNGGARISLLFGFNSRHR